MKHAQVLAACLVMAGCSQETPQVEVNTYVGESYMQSDPQLAQEAALKVWSAVLDEFEASTPKTVQVEATVTVHPPKTPSELEDLVTAIRKGPLDEIAGPARRIAAASPTLWPQVKTRLLAERKAPKGDYRSLLSAIGGDVPNKYGYFALAWKKAHGHSVKLSEDWFEDLLALPRGKVSAGLLPVYRDCVLETALLRAATVAGQEETQASDVVEALLDAAYLHRGTFRDEAGRALVGVGDEAVPQLVLASISPSNRKRDQDKPEVRRAKFADLILDKMNRLQPSRATAALRRSPRLLASVLEAYGTKRPGEAADVLLAFADDRSPRVRAAARTAFSFYVDGPPPKSAGRTVRLLGGGTGRALAYLNYRDRARLALQERLGQDAPSLLEEPCEVVREDGRVDETCQDQPARHTTAYFTWLDERRLTQQRVAVEEALAKKDPEQTLVQLDRLVAQGELAQPVPIAEFFAEYGERIAAQEPARAAALYRKSSRLLRGHDDDRADALHTKALVAEASLEDLPRAGRLMLLDRALEVAPSPQLTQTRDALASAPAVATQAPSTTRLVGGAGLVSLILIGFGALGGPLRRRLLGRRESSAD